MRRGTCGKFVRVAYSTRKLEGCPSPRQRTNQSRRYIAEVGRSGLQSTTNMAWTTGGRKCTWIANLENCLWEMSYAGKAAYQVSRGKGARGDLHAWMLAEGGGKGVGRSTKFERGMQRSTGEGGERTCMQIQQSTQDRLEVFVAGTRDLDGSFALPGNDGGRRQSGK